MQQKIKAGVIGSAGYTGGELLRLLVRHPAVDIAFAHSVSHAGQPLSLVHADLLGDTDLHFSEAPAEGTDVLFLCLGHGDARAWLDRQHPGPEVKIIDLSQDFRLEAHAGHAPTGRQFVYGLPELNRPQIQEAVNIANPGCFATALQLALLPLAYNQLLRTDVHISGTTGSTGAGHAHTPTSHFSWRFGNQSVYKPFEHQHLNEVYQSLRQLQPDLPVGVHFIPNRGAFARGIIASVYTDYDGDLKTARDMYRTYYDAHPFTHVSLLPPDVKQVANTNKCYLHLEQYGDKLLIVSVIDNLLKGASGQAVQNMNLLFGLGETEGLLLKGSAF